MSITKIKRREASKSKNFKKFIDFDKENQVFFDNFYLDDLKFVVKLPLIVGQRNKSKVPEVKVEKFNLSKYTFLTSY
ncbi:MAG: hypothetical protein R6U96_19190 [Promethearchaeia archaeon]